MTYHSESYQDAFAENYFKSKRGGTFVEFGALDGILHSNSLYLEKEYGWNGLLIEANPSVFPSLQQNRPNCKTVNAAVYDHEGVVEFEKIAGTLYGWSGIREAIEPQQKKRIESFIPVNDREIIEVPCRTLDSILKEAKITTIDYLSIDVEGAEYKIISTFPFENYTIDLVGIEDNFGNPKIDALMKSKNFVFMAKVGNDRIYRFNAQLVDVNA